MEMRSLLGADVFVRVQDGALLFVTRPDTGRRAVPAFLTGAGARAFWPATAPGALVQMAFRELAGQAARVGAVVLDPGADDEQLLERGDLIQLAEGEVPGEFAAWLREPARLGRTPADVLARLRRVHVHVITGRGDGGEQRLYLLEKSEDGTLAVACFSSPETLAQFAQVRRLFEGEQGYAVALVTGAHCLRVAAGMGAYVLLDPESPWETQLEPMLM